MVYCRSEHCAMFLFAFATVLTNNVTCYAGDTEVAGDVFFVIRDIFRGLYVFDTPGGGSK